MAVPTSNITLLSIQQEFGGAAANRALKNYYGAAAGVPTSGAIKFKDFAGKSADIVGSQLFESSGTFTVPAGVTKVHVCCVGGGGRGAPVVDQARSGGTGGACAYKNNIAVTPGQQITVNVTVDGDVGMEVGTYFKNTSTCNARTGFQTATGLGANNTGDAAFRGGMGGTGGMMKYITTYFALTHAMAGGGGGAASMVSNGPRGGNSINPGTGSSTPFPQEGGNGLTASRAGGGGGAAGTYYYLDGSGVENPEYLPDTNSPSGLMIWGWSSNRGGGVGVDYAGPTGTAGIGSKTAGAPIINSTQTVTAPTNGGQGSNGDYGAGGGAGINPGTSKTNVYKGSDGAVNIKWGNSNTFPWL
jgi:hypothetical protein